MTVRVRVTDNGFATAQASVTLTVAAAQTEPPPPQTETPPPTSTTPPATTIAPATSAASGPAAVAPPAANPSALATPAALSASAPAGQRLKRQRAVRLRVTCPAGCRLVLSGTVKVGGKRLRLSRLARSLGAGQTATLAIGVDSRDLAALRRSRGRATASVKISSSGAITTVKTIVVSLAS